MKRDIQLAPDAAFAHLGRHEKGCQVNSDKCWVSKYNACVQAKNLLTCENVGNMSEMRICVPPLLVKVLKLHI